MMMPRADNIFRKLIKGLILILMAALGFVSIVGTGGTDDTTTDSTLKWVVQKEEQDSTNDGVKNIDKVYVYSYNNSKELVKKEMYNDPDQIDSGSPDETRVNEYDADGNNTKEKVYNGVADDSPDEVITYTYTDGKLTKGQDDVGNDGAIDSEFLYDSKGSKKEIKDLNYNLTSSFTYEYDEHDKVTKIYSDWDNDGAIDNTAISANTYDENGNLIKVENDDDGDGNVDTTIYYTLEQI